VAFHWKLAVDRLVDLNAIELVFVRRLLYP
jgi:hypothetical protein